MGTGLRHDDGTLMGVVGSMAWRLTGDRLRIVWFVYNDCLYYDIKNGVPLSTTPFKSYEETKQKMALRERRRRARTRA